MHSRSAACVFGEARLISSTSSRLAKTGPGLNSNSFERWLKTFTPVTSDGSRSGVNCMREKETSSDLATALASIVLPTPGKSSRIRCPSLTRQSVQSCNVSAGAWTTRARLSVTARIVSAAASVSTRWLPGSVTQQLLSRVYDRDRDPVFGRLREPALRAAADQHNLVLRRVEPHVVAGDVVVDDQINALPLELLSRAQQTSLTTIGSKADEHLAVGPPLRERSEDVCGRLEDDFPRLLVFCTVLVGVLGRAVVGDGSRHQDEVRICTRECGFEHRVRRRRLHHVDSRRHGHGKVGGKQRHVGAPLPSLLGERHPHATGGTVSEEADRVERFPRSAGRYEHMAPC